MSNSNPILGETIISMGDVARKLTISCETAWRWATKGVRARGTVVVLESIQVGGRRLTSEQALARFVARQDEIRASASLTPRPDSQPIRSRSPRACTKDRAAAAGKELEAMGA